MLSFGGQAWRFVLGLLTGASLSEPFRKVLLSAGTRAVLVIVPVGLGGVVSVASDDLAAATRNLWTGKWGVPGVWLPVVLGTATFGWGVLLYLRMTAEDFERRRRDEQLTDHVARLHRAIFRAPNSQVIQSYSKVFRGAAREVAPPVYLPLLRRVETAGADPARALAALESAIRQVLYAVAVMARSFGGRPDGAIYGCSILLLDKPVSSSDERFRSLRNRDLLFAGTRTLYRDWLKAVLFTSHGLCVDTSREAPGANGTSMFEPRESALPIPSADDDPPLLGAPDVLGEGRPRVYPDTSDFHLRFGSWEEKVRGQVKEYFSPGGPGEAIRSFACFRIGTGEDPIGVLNIHCDETHLLGEVEDYYVTFTALVTPFLHILVRPLEVYSGIQAKIWDQESTMLPASGAGVEGR